VPSSSQTNFPPAPSGQNCNNGGTNNNTVNNLGGNGILGVGLFRQDCGFGCTSQGGNVTKLYYICPNGSCSTVPVAAGSQIQNPVGMFPQDNNGVLVSLPSVPATGSPSASGSLIFGIGTQSNNSSSGTTQVNADQSGEMTATFNGTSYANSYIDSGSNGWFFPSSIATCASPNSSFYCPGTTQSLSVQLGGPTVQFSIADANTLFNSGGTAFNDLGGPESSSNSTTFDAGLPFFFGRKVFVALEGPSGGGQHWAL
jgi:hypothetical protein